MDILVYVLLIIVIGVFFFLDKYTKTQNAMFVVILISFIGFIMLQNSNIEVVDYTEVIKINSTLTSFDKVDVTNDGLGLFNVQSFLVLIMWFFMILASINLLLGKEYK